MSDFSTDPIAASETRANFLRAGKDASDEELMRLSSAMHLGLTMLSMIENVEEAKAAMERGELEAGGQIMATTMIGHRTNGNTYGITISPVTAEDVEQHDAMAAKAKEAGRVVPNTTH